MDREHLATLEDLAQRFVAAYEAQAQKPPLIVAMQQPQDGQTKDAAPPKTIDGKRFRHQLTNGGWLIELAGETPLDEPQLWIEMPDKDRVQVWPSRA